MSEIATRPRRARTRTRDLWQSVPLDLAGCVAAILLAAGLKLLGVMP